MARAELQKRYEYKMYTPLGVYLGLLPSNLIVSDFGYNQLIGTAFAQMQITVAQSADVAGQATDPLTDESGNAITDESGNIIYIERQPDVVGSSNSNALIANNNLVVVVEYSSYYPNGLQVFSGYVSKWKTTFGQDDDIVVTCISNGSDLNNYLVSTGDVSLISQATDNGSSVTSTSAGFGQWILQTFSVASAFQISAVSLELTATVQGTLQVSIKQQLGTSPSPAGGDPIVASGTVIVPIQTKTVTKISFSSPTTLNPAYTYYMQIYWGDASNLTIFASSVQPYAAGSVYTMTSSGTTFSTPVLQSGYSLYFIVWQYGGNVTGTYTNQDPSTILTSVMSNYTSNGGLITPPLSTITALFSQSYGDTNVPGAFWSTAIGQVVSPTSNLTFDTIQIKLPIGSTSVPTPGLYRGDPSLDTVTVISGAGSYGLGGANASVALPAVLSATINPNNGLATIVFASSVTLTGGTAYYLVWFYSQGTYTTNLIGSSSVNPTPSTPFGSLYSALVTVNNSSAGMTKPSGISALYMVLGLGAGSSPNGGYSSTGVLTSYTFKMQTILQAIQAIATLAPSTWYWYVDPATGLLQFALSSTTADITIIRGRHIDELDIEATKENIKNVAYFTGGDDGTGTSKNILVKVTGTKGTNRTGLALLSDNRVNSTTGGTVTARQIAQNYLDGHSAETYITNVIVQDQTMDINLFKVGMMVGFAGWGNFVDALLLQVVGVNRAPDQITLQLGTLPVRDSKTVADLQAQLAYQQTVANPTTPS